LKTKRRIRVVQPGCITHEGNAYIHGYETDDPPEILLRMANNKECLGGIRRVMFLDEISDPDVEMTQEETPPPLDVIGSPRTRSNFRRPLLSAKDVL